MGTFVRWTLALGVVGLATAAPATPAGAVGADSDPARVRHVLARLAFGPAPGDVGRVTAMGVEAYVRAQLADRGDDEPGALARELAGNTAIQDSPARLYAKYGERPDKDDPAAKQLRRRVANGVLADARRARLQRAVASPHQLREVMTAFWFDHFNVFSGKGPLRLWTGAYEAQAIRPHALGRFRDLLGAVAHHPAMLFYLDNWQSTGGGRARKRGLNENYARELMELHTLGVDGGYAQADVVALARILTGWGFAPKPAQTSDGYTFTFDPRRHDMAPKLLLGTAFQAGDQSEGERALDLLAAHPPTARHVARKLAIRFVADDPPDDVVAAVAARFTASGGDMRATLAALVAHPAFWAQPATRFKPPYQLVVSTARALGPLAPPPEALAQALERLGQPIYGCLTPDGYKATEAAWLSPGALNQRITFAVAAANGRLKQPEWPATGLNADALAGTLGQPFGARSRQAIAAAPRRLRAGLVLGSPEFNRY